jgi:hypothetical protein
MSAQEMILPIVSMRCPDGRQINSGLAPHNGKEPDALRSVKADKKSSLLFTAMQITNQALWDRLLRLAIGLAMIYVGWLGSPVGLLGAAMRVFGPIPVITGLLGWDPLYAILGICTLRK